MGREKEMQRKRERELDGESNGSHPCSTRGRALLPISPVAFHPLQEVTQLHLPLRATGLELWQQPLLVEMSRG